MKRSLSKIITPEWGAGFTKEDGEVKLDRSMHLTPRAVSWRQKGKLLKQIMESPWTFEIARKPCKGKK